MPKTDAWLPTSTRMFESIRDKLVAREFQIELFNCEVTQCDCNDPIVHRGIGFVTQSKDGTLNFTLPCQEVDSRFDAFSETDSEYEPGKILIKSNHYTITGHDLSGNTWYSEMQNIEYDQYKELRIRAKLSTLSAEQKSTKGNKDKEYKGWYILEELTLPIKPGKNTWEHHSGTMSWRGTTDQHGNTELTFHDSQMHFNQRAQNFIRGISILCGYLFTPLCSYHFSGDIQIITIQGAIRAPARNKLVPFIPRDWPYEGCWNNFLEAWISADNPSINRPLQDFLYHHFARLSRAYEEDAENSVQVLCSSIEGLLRELHQKKGDIDSDYVNTIQDTLERSVRAGFELGERVKGLLEGAQQNALRPSIGSVFLRLIAEGLLEQPLYLAWKSVRHKAAHGELVGASDESYQSHITAFFKCLEVFKRIMFDSIGYTGKTHDYSRGH